MKKTKFILIVIAVLTVLISVNLFAEIDQRIMEEMREITNQHRESLRDSRAFLTKGSYRLQDMEIAEHIYQYIGWESPDDWINSEKVLYSYDDQGRLAVMYSYFWDNFLEDWIYFPITINFIWDENDLLTQFVYNYTDEDISIDFLIVNQYFNNNNQITLVEQYVYDEELEEMILGGEFEFFYSAGRIDYGIMTDYEYMEYYKTSITYDTNGRLDTLTSEFSFDEVNWYLDEMSMVMYHPHDNSGYQDFQDFANLMGVQLDYFWTPWAMFESETWYEWSGDGWDPLDRDYYTYTALYNLESRIYQEYEPFEGWYDVDRTLYLYADRGNLEEVREQYMHYDEGWTDYGRYLITMAETSDLDESLLKPVSLKINNYPNPFNPETTIRFELPSSQAIELSIINIKGQKVRTLIDEVKSIGVHCIIWDGRDDLGNTLASGVYFYRLTGDNSTATGKMMLLK